MKINSKFYLVLFVLIKTFLNQTAVYAQGKSYSFKPQWRLGEKKNITISRSEIGLKNDTVISDETTVLPATLEITGETKYYYTVSILMQNVAWQAVIDMYEKLGDELKEYQNINLIYKVYKSNKEAQLINASNMKNFMTKSITQMKELMDRKIPEEENVSGILFRQVEELFKDEVAIKQYANDELGFMFYPYGKTLNIGDTTTDVTLGANPFNPLDTVNETKRTWVNPSDVSKKYIKVNVTNEIDLEKFKVMLAQMMSNMVKSFGQSEKKVDEVKSQRAEFDMSHMDHRILYFNLSSTWVDKVIFKGVASTTTPKGKTEKRTITTVTVE